MRSMPGGVPGSGRSSKVIESGGPLRRTTQAFISASPSSSWPTRAYSGLGLAGLLTGVAGNVLITSLFGVAAYTQPAIGRFYLAGHQDLAQGLYYDAAQPVALVVVGLLSVALLSASFIVFGVAVARTSD